MSEKVVKLENNFNQVIERKIAVIFVTDVVGFSKLMEINEDETLKSFRACKDILDKLFAEHGGRIFNTAGDSVLAEFQSAVSAVVCANEFQKLLKERNNSVSDNAKMNFRIGLNMGDVIVEGDNLYGDGVNVAARMEPLAKPGGICISGKFYDEVHRKLELIFENVGAHEVKNIANPVQTYHVMLDQSSDVATYDNGPDVNKANDQKAIPIKNEKPRLIVLPFVNSNNNEDNEFLVDGIVEDIITEFSRLNSIEIISRHSAFGCKNKGLDNSQIVKQFNVNYIATGSIRSSGNRIRISVELTDPGLGNSIWSERYDRTMEDIFDVQDEIVRQISKT